MTDSSLSANGAIFRPNHEQQKAESQQSINVAADADENNNISRETLKRQETIDAVHKSIVRQMQFAKYQGKAFNKVRDEINEIITNNTDILANEQAESTMINSMIKLEKQLAMQASRTCRK